MKTALLVIDVQNDFCPSGALEVTGGNEIIADINQEMKKYNCVVLTQDWHPKGHSSFAMNHDGKEPFEVDIIRDIIKIQSVKHESIGNIGYLRITSFTEQTESGLIKSIESIKKRLSSHSMFSTNERLELILMCEDCRVGAMFTQNDKMLEAKDRPKPRTTDDYLN